MLNTLHPLPCFWQNRTGKTACYKQSGRAKERDFVTTIKAHYNLTGAREAREGFIAFWFCDDRCETEGTRNVKVSQFIHILVVQTQRFLVVISATQFETHIFRNR